MNLEYNPRLLHKATQVAVTKAVDRLLENPDLGQQKKGALSHIFIYKFKHNQQEYLLAYSFDTTTMTLVAVGLHEKFYRDIKR